MKAQDLSIGDWVKFPIGPDKIVDLPYIAGIGFCASFPASATLFPVVISNLEPIQLTKEIIERNFVKKTFHGIFEDYFDLTIREYSDSLYIVDYHCCEMALPDQQVTVCFVHELQHFLTHCGIDKEIIL